MSIMDYNGSAIVAMVGKDCVGIACDRRLGVNQFQTISNNFQKVFRMNERSFVGLAGLATDVTTVSRLMKMRVNLYEMREDRVMNPATVASVLSSLLYEHRFGPYFLGPIVCGLEDKTNKPFIASFDLIGAETLPKNFVVSGTASEQLYGACESFYKENMNEEELFETLSQCLLSSVDRDCVSGWGGIVHVMTADKVVTRTLKGRQD